jgi:hypothetical protein
MSFDQLCDATLTVPGLPLAFGGLYNRRAPGDGEFSIGEIILDRTLSAAK